MFLRNAYSRARYVRGVMFARVRRVLRGMRLHKKFLLGHQPCPSNKNFFAQLETEGQNYEKTFGTRKDNISEQCPHLVLRLRRAKGIHMLPTAPIGMIAHDAYSRARVCASMRVIMFARVCEYARVCARCYVLREYARVCVRCYVCASMFARVCASMRVIMFARSMYDVCRRLRYYNMTMVARVCMGTFT